MPRFLIFLLWLLCAPALGRDLPPVLLLLNGTGSAGKSSIGKALVKSLAHATFVSEEKLVFNAYLDILKQRGLTPPRPLRDLAELMAYRATLPAALEASLRGEFRRRGQAYIWQDRSTGLQGMRRRRAKASSRELMHPGRWRG